MDSKKKYEIENPMMKKGQVIIVEEDCNRGEDIQLIKVATRDGRFNEFEYGISAGGGGDNLVVITPTDDGFTCNKTYTECLELFNSGRIIANYKFCNENTSSNNVIPCKNIEEFEGNLNFITDVGYETSLCIAYLPTGELIED